MQGFRLNPDKEHVAKIIEGIFRKEGHCPCQIKEDDTTLCPCTKFLDDKNCCCKLYIPKE
ncbi:MAG: ferredoxin-thioredoxin reductase catalytic domain-containing protein [Clostridia bacterium]|nr:ferredoxin-thioredoxin reductase catalytic domain-containing protein [Clostridia bacterium]